jgi:endoglucanase
MCSAARRGFAGALMLGLLVVPASSAAPPDVIRTGGPSAPSAPKVAVVGTSQRVAGDRFRVVNGAGRTVLRGRLKPARGSPRPWRFAATADLSGISKPGRYRVRAAGEVSRPWVVDRGAVSRLVRQLRRIFAVNSDGNEPSPVFDPAHLNDAIVRGGALDGQRVDLTGGWRDAGDNLKIALSTASAVSYLHLAARLDRRDAAALHAVSDVGVRWLLKAHPGPGIFLGQVGDDRDHSTGFRDPAGDDANAEDGVGVRYAYPTTSSNVAGAVAAALALAASRSDGDRRAQLVVAARDWYALGKATNAIVPVADPNVAEDYYPDDIFTDDLAFAATELFRVTGEAPLLEEANSYFRQGDDDRQLYSGTTPGAVGPVVAAELCGGLGAPTPAGPARDAGCEALGKVVSAARERARATAFGSPGIFTFGWVQDNTGVGAVAAAARRAGVASDGLRIAAAARDYMLGRNPWGVSFVVGPGRHDARQPHHPAYLEGRPARLLNGAVVGGPVAPESVREFDLKLARGPFRRFNSGAVVYEDRRADFVTNEVGLSYSAGAILLAASLGR